MSDRKILVFENTFVLTNFLLKEFSRIVHEAVQERGRCSVALSGGKTPTEFYTRLSQWEEFDLWQKTHIFQVDEHFVTADDAENNWRMINEHLLNFVPIPRHNLHPIKTDDPNVLVATEEYKHELIYFFDVKPGGLPRFDLVILGCGEDGHVGSIHPGLEGFGEINRFTMPVITHYFKTERVTLTLPVINNARYVVMLIQGERKRDVVKEILENNLDVPAAQLKARNGQLTWLMDRTAASKLSHQHKYTDQGEAISL